jgi:lysophospholipase L1-like esterase
MRKIILNLLLSMITIVCCFALGEAAFRLFALDRQIVYELDEELYWRFRPAQHGFFWMGYASSRSPETRINNLGLRGADMALPASATTRILALGDSYAFGLGVGEQETFCAVLEKALAGQVEVINGGVPGFGIFQMQRLLHRLVPLLRPQVILVVFPTGDVFRQPFASVEEERAYLEAEKKRKRWRRFSQFATFLYRKYYYAKIRLTGKMPGVPSEILSNKADFTALWQKDLARLAEMARTCKQSGALMVVMPWPQHTNAEWDSLVLAGVRSLAGGAVGLVDLDQALAPYPNDQLIIAGDGHPSAAAHKIAGLYLAAAMKKLAVVPD